MNTIDRLSRNINDVNKVLFEKYGEKNILVVSTQLSLQDLFKWILPFLNVDKAKDSHIILSQLKKYSTVYPSFDITNFRNLTDKQIQWADYIVFPFTYIPISQLFYQRIYDIAPLCKICYSVDYNFMQMPDYINKSIYLKQDEVRDDIFRNILYSDIVFFWNEKLLEAIKKYAEQFAKDNEIDFDTDFVFLPLFIDADSIIENVDYSEEEPIYVDSIKKTIKNISQTK